MLIRFRHVVIIVAAMLLSGCQIAMLNPKGIIAASEKQLLLGTLGLMLLIVIPTIILSFIIAWRYRASNAKAAYSPEWSHSNLVEVLMWSIPGVIILILAVITWISSHSLDPYRPLQTKQKPLIIQAVSLNWKWLFIYPKQQVASVNFVQIPLNRPVRFLITGEGPMNSLEIPQLAGQIYSMAGSQTKLNLMAHENGDYAGVSANYSGEGFSDMKFVVRVSSDKAFNQWIAKAKASHHPLTIQRYKQLAKPSEHQPVVLYSAVADHLFKRIILKYRQPGMESMTEDLSKVTMQQPLMGKKDV